MWSRFKDLLQQTEESSIGNPVEHKMLVRSVLHEIEYDKWTTDGTAAETIEWLLRNFESYHHGGKSDRSIAFLDTPSKKGFVLYLTDGTKAINQPEFLMDFIKDSVEKLGYVHYTSDVKVYSKGVYVETQQRHYLKPPMNFAPNQKLSQLFGNISIDYLLRNDKSYIFKFSTTTYQDHMFEDAAAFEQLMRSVLKIN